MSHNQSRADRIESTQHKKIGRPGSFHQQRQFSGSVSNKGGGGTSSAPLNSSNRGVKKYNGNGPGVQSRPRSPNVSTGYSSSYTSQALQNDVSTGYSSSYTSQALQNDVHKQQPTNITNSASNVDPMDATPQQVNQVVPRPPSSDISVAAPSFNPSTASSESKATTMPAKTPGDASRSFPLQFGSISPGFMNGVQIPARTSSAPPNLDEQKKDQVEDVVNDAPRAAEFLSRILAQVILEKIVAFSAIGHLIYEGGEKQGCLVEIGLQGGILETIKSEKDDSVLNEIRSSSNLQLENFRPPGSKKSCRLDKFI